MALGMLWGPPGGSLGRPRQLPFLLRIPQRLGGRRRLPGAGQLGMEASRAQAGGCGAPGVPWGQGSWACPQGPRPQGCDSMGSRHGPRARCSPLWLASLWGSGWHLVLALCDSQWSPQLSPVQGLWRLVSGVLLGRRLCSGWSQGRRSLWGPTGAGPTRAAAVPCTPTHAGLSQPPRASPPISSPLPEPPAVQGRPPSFPPQERALADDSLRPCSKVAGLPPGGLACHLGLACGGLACGALPG